MEDKKHLYSDFLLHFINYSAIFATNLYVLNAEIVFNIPPYYPYYDHDPLGGYVNFHSPTRLLLTRNNVRRPNESQIILFDRMRVKLFYLIE
jgi:hypothetical protein